MQQRFNWFLYIASASVNLLGFSNGIAYGWTSPVLPILESNGAHNPLDNPNSEQDSSWVTALLCLGAAIGPVFAGQAAKRFGRKRTLMVVTLPMIATYLVFAYATNIAYFYVARFVLGVCVGAVYTIIPMYIAEISEKENRGQLGCFLSVLQTLGMLFCYAVGPFVSIHTLSLLCLIPLAMFMLIFGIFIPESPYYLIRTGDFVGAEKSLRMLRATSDEQIKSEINDTMVHIKESNENKKTYKDMFTDKANVKALYISGCLMFIQELSGISIVLSYMQPIFEQTNSTIASHHCTIIVGTVQVVVTFFTSQLIDRLGRKILLVTSAVIACLSLGALGAYFFLQELGYDVEPLYWLPVVSLMCYIISYNLGIGPVGWAIMGEIFSPNIKIVATTITVFIYFLFGFATTVLFPSLNQLITIAGSFWLFSSCCFLATLFIVFFVPETKGKSLQEIQTILGKK